MSNDFYELIDDVQRPSRWFLGSPRDAQGCPLNPESFRVGRHTEVVAPLSISVRRTGEPLDFTFADFDMPVLSQRAADLFVDSPETTQLIPAVVDGYDGLFSVANFLHVRSVVDESRSEFLKWQEADSRPDKLGQYRQFTRLIVDPGRAAGARVFRIEGWRIALIVSEALKLALEDARVSGIRFGNVTRPKPTSVARGSRATDR